ncbi:MAG: sulfite exporter TauE/SafE family protein [Sedimentisphaerales bacterium]|nr:sulfite exporter TauE/SafE family protein [Sedimentisphaerales bacterium]
MDYVIFMGIGLAMGLLGGLLGIGGGVVMIPAMVFFFGENQHLYQAASIICAFGVSCSAVIAHKKANAIVPDVIKWLLPASAMGVIAGVAISNCEFFRGPNSYLLARVFGGFLVYVAIASIFRLLRPDKKIDGQVPKVKHPEAKSLAAGIITGTCSGMLGIGAGSVSTILQQVFLKMPIKKAMSNSAVVIICSAFVGAVYKNATLSDHGIEVIDSIKIAACVTPTAIIGGYIGGHSMHILPKKAVRIAFIIIVILSAIRMLTVKGFL